VIDDDRTSGPLMRTLFGADGLEVHHALTGQDGLRLAAETRPAVVILDLQLPDVGGLDVLQKLHADRPDLPVLMLTGHADVKSAVKAMQLGALQYLTKPVDPEELQLIVRRAMERSRMLAELSHLRRRAGPEALLAEQMGPSEAVQRIAAHVQRVARSNFTVLILGETGTGKEVVAQAIHRESERRERPLVALDCGAIPSELMESELFGHEKGAFTGAERKRTGHFQMADGGTLFMDEIGNLPPAPQAKLLRVLESREVKPVGGDKPARLDIRFIAATNRDLAARARDGTFREDLYFRLAQYTIALPALRERVEDISHLAHRFLQEASLELHRPVYELQPDAVEMLHRHRWPGNVRELRNVIRLAALQSTEPVIDGALISGILERGSDAAARTVPASGSAPLNGRPLREIAEAAASSAERVAIAEALKTTGGNKSAAAKLLQTDYKTLHLKIQRHGLKARDFEAD